MPVTDTLDEIFFLDREDAEVFKAMKHDFLTRRAKEPSRTPHDSQENHFAPEVYSCLVPAGGIPALAVIGTGTDDDFPGFADDCPIYRIQEYYGTGTAPDDAPYLTRVPYITKTVYNLTSTAIEGDTWIAVFRDKFGRWIAGTSGGGPTSGSLMNWIKITSNMPENALTEPGVYPGVRRIRRGFVFYNGPDVKVIFAEGVTPIPNRIYLGKYEETLDASGTGTGSVSGTGSGTADTIDLYSCSVNDKNLVEYCINGQTFCDEEFPVAPYRVNVDVNCSGTGSGTLS